MKNTISVIMPVYNQEELIVQTSQAIITNMSEHVKEIIFIIDGCTDNTEKNLNSIIKYFPFPPKIVYTPNIFEVRATNVGFKLSSCEYSFFIQDDMVVIEKDFDQRLMKPMNVVSDVFAVSARDAQDVIEAEQGVIDRVAFINTAGKDVGTSRDMFCIRDSINRGPILFDNKKAEQLGYMDEAFAPQSLDDVEISLRAYTKKGWLVGAYGCDYISEPQWGTGRKNPTSYRIWLASQAKNMNLLVKRYGSYFKQEKHDKDLVIE